LSQDGVLKVAVLKYSLHSTKYLLCEIIALCGTDRLTDRRLWRNTHSAAAPERRGTPNSDYNLLRCCDL